MVSVFMVCVSRFCFFTLPNTVPMKIIALPIRMLFFLSTVVVLNGCLGPLSELYPEEDAERPVPVHIVRVGWHAGLVVETEFVAGQLPSHPEIPDGRWMKIGWGDDRYYPDPDPPFRVLVRAALWPSGSVLHLVGMDVPPGQFFPGAEVVTLHLSEKGMEQMGRFLSDAFQYDEDGCPVYQETGRYGKSAFFRARGRYYIPKTSNVFTARALRRAGVPVTPVYAVTAGNVMWQTRRLMKSDSGPD